MLGTGAANLAGLLDIDQVLLGGRTVAAAPEAFVQGVGAVLDARARREGGHDGAVPVRLAPGGPRGVAEGAAQLLLAPSSAGGRRLRPVGADRPARHPGLRTSLRGLAERPGPGGSRPLRDSRARARAEAARRQGADRPSRR